MTANRSKSPSQIPPRAKALWPRGPGFWSMVEEVAFSNTPVAQGPAIFWKIRRTSFRYINGPLDYFCYFFGKLGEPVSDTPKISPSKQNPYRTSQKQKKSTGLLLLLFRKIGQAVFRYTNELFLTIWLQTISALRCTPHSFAIHQNLFVFWNFPFAIHFIYNHLRNLKIKWNSHRCCCCCSSCCCCWWTCCCWSCCCVNFISNFSDELQMSEVHWGVLVGKSNLDHLRVIVVP